MTDEKDFKRVVRERAAKTGERYASAREHLLAAGGERADAGLELSRDQLTNLVRLYWAEFRPTLAGLSDSEYRWEPVPGCPNIRRHGDGTYRNDNQSPVQGAASIAQRLCWAAQLTLVDTNQHFGDKSITWKEVAIVPGKAAEGVAFLEQAIDRWVEALGSAPAGFFEQHSENRSPGAIDGQFPFMGVAIFHFQLLVQCCSQVSMLRNLYSARKATR